MVCLASFDAITPTALAVMDYYNVLVEVRGDCEGVASANDPYASALAIRRKEEALGLPNATRARNVRPTDTRQKYGIAAHPLRPP
jgi:uncharacterized protein YmfQ (DUF2313 family)